MKLKTNLHLHTSDDPYDTFISYSTKEAIDRAATLGFEVLALTLHERCGYTKERAAYAREKNILLIPGIEKFIENKHVLILGCDHAVLQIETFKDLAAYKATRPEICIIAPHPYFPGAISLGKKLEEHSTLFDAVEKSWFANNSINYNRKARAVAEKNNLPFIATSDTHFLKYLDIAYTLLEVEEKTEAAVLKAIKTGSFENKSKPARFFADMLWQVGVKTILPSPWDLYRGKKKDT